jgi:hypothetical protein
VGKTLPRGWYADYVVREARLGNPAPLIARFENFLQLRRHPLSRGEIDFIIEALEATEKKRAKDNLRQIERMLIAAQVEDMIASGTPRKAAIEAVAVQRDRSIRHVEKAIPDHMKRRHRHRR